MHMQVTEVKYYSYVSKEGGRLLTSVYRKPTHTERYIPYHSHHHPRTTMGVLRCMRDRACSICHPTKMQQKTDHLNQVFQANGFPEKPGEEDPNDPPTTSPRNLGTRTTGRSTQGTVHPLHQGAKWEDSKGLCPSGGEARLQTKENSEKRTNAGEEQDPRAETDRSDCVISPVRKAQRCTWEKPRGHWKSGWVNMVKQWNEETPRTVL